MNKIIRWRIGHNPSNDPDSSEDNIEWEKRTYGEPEHAMAAVEKQLSVIWVYADYLGEPAYWYWSNNDGVYVVAMEVYDE